MKTAKKNIELTAEMIKVIDTLHQICDENGYFEFNDLRATGLSSVEVRAAIVALNKAGYSISQNKTTCFGGASFYGWQWHDVAWSVKYAEYEYSQRLKEESLAAEQAAAVAEVERMLTK